MNIKEINDKVNSLEYDFLRSEESLKDHICLLTLGGSYSYGTNIDTPDHQSDLDIRGIYLHSPKEILTMKCKDSPFEHSKTDTVIYPLNQMISLLLSCNPNIIETMGTKDEHVLICTKEAKLLKDNIDAFISKRASMSFGGYATQQLRRLQNALARDEYPQSQKEQHILESIFRQMETMEDRYQDFTNKELKLYIDNSDKKGYENEIFMDANLEHYPLRDFKNIYSELNNIVGSYDKLNHRNSKKDEVHLLKHAMHLVRLHLMYIDLASTGKIITYREKDKDLLLDIRNGKYTYKEIFDMVNDLQKDVDYANKNTILSDKPDMERVNDIVQIINKSALENI